MALSTFKLLGVAASLLTYADAAAILRRQSLPSPLHYFSFGNSYTATGFDPDGEQPSAGNPMGNPGLGYGTTTGGPNYVGWLTTKYNSTTVFSYNFAIGGATITNSQVPTVNPDIHTFEQQVEDYFLPHYGGGDDDGKFWGSDDSYFSVFFGINDIGIPLTSAPEHLEDKETRIPALLDAYFSFVGTLYDVGARRFLFVGVPPSYRSPYITGLGAKLAATYADWVNAFNGQLAERVEDFVGEHEGAVSATFDYHHWMQGVLDDPVAYGFPDAGCINTDGVSCVWWDGYHPGSRLNDLLAQRMQPAMNSLGFDGSTPVGGVFS